LNNFIQQRTEAWKKIDSTRFLLSLLMGIWIIYFTIILFQIAILRVMLSHEINFGITITVIFIVYIILLPKSKGLFKKEFRV